MLSAPETPDCVIVEPLLVSYGRRAEAIAWTSHPLVSQDDLLQTSSSFSAEFMRIATDDAYRMGMSKGCRHPHGARIDVRRLKCNS